MLPDHQEATDVLALLADRLDPPANRYRHDPAAWVRERLGEHFWSAQVDIANAVAAHRRVAVRSAHGTGKSFSASRLIAWWIDTHPIGEAFVVSSAPTAKQVEAILWREINKAAVKADPPLPGRVLTTEWKIGNELIAFGRKPADHDPHGFQGIHAKYVLVVLDEACGIPEQLWIAALALATNEHSRILAIGNPDDSLSHFKKVCTPGSGWHTLRISAFDSPNFTGEPIPGDLADYLVSAEFVEDMRRDVGEDSPIYRSKVEGEFSEDASDAVVPYSWANGCRAVTIDAKPGDMVELGVDVGAGGDASVIRERRGMTAGRVWRRSTPEPHQLVDMVLHAISETGATRVKIDSIGVGWGVAGRLRELRTQGVHDAAVIPVNVGESSTDPARFPKLRDQLWWEVGRKLSEQRSWSLPEDAVDDRTIADLTSPRWQPDAAGRVKVEPKDETRKRLGRSPDDADALLLAFYVGGDVIFAPDAEQTPETALDGSTLHEPLAGRYAIAPEHTFAAAIGATPEEDFVLP